MANFKFVKSATALVLGASVLTSAVVVPGANASAKTTYKVNKNGTLVNAKTNKTVKGYVSYKGKLYKDGKKFTGLYNKKYYYKSGVKATGTYKGAYYVKGVKKVTTGTYNGKYYVKGALYTGKTSKNVYYVKGVKFTGVTKYGYTYKDGKRVEGEYNGKVYTNGKLVTGVYKDKLYKAGVLVKGFALEKEKLYKDGVLNIGLALFQEKLYKDAGLATGIFTYNGVEDQYKDGVVVPTKVESVSAVNSKTLELKGTNLSKLTAADITVANNTVTGVTFSTDRTTATVTVKDELAVNNVTKVTVKDASFDVTYKIEAKQISVVNATYDDDTAKQFVKILVDGKAVTAQELLSAGYNVTFSAYAKQSGGTALNSVFAAASTSTGQLDSDLDTALATELAGVTLPAGTTTLPIAGVDVYVQVKVTKGSEVIESELSPIKIKNTDLAADGITATTLTNAGADKDASITTDNFVQSSRTLTTGDLANYTSIKVKAGSDETKVTSNYTVASSNAAVVSVTKAGQLKAEGPGTATITISYGGATRTETVTVVNGKREASKVTVAGALQTVAKGATGTAYVTVVDQFGDPFAGTLTVVNSDKTVATTVDTLPVTTAGDAALPFTALKAGSTSVTFKDAAGAAISSNQVKVTVTDNADLKKYKLTANDGVIADTDADALVSGSKAVEFSTDTTLDMEADKYLNINLTGVNSDGNPLADAAQKIASGDYDVEVAQSRNGVLADINNDTKFVKDNGGSLTIKAGDLTGTATITVKNKANNTIVGSITVTVTKVGYNVTSATFKDVQSPTFGKTITYKDVLNYKEAGTGKDPVITGLGLTKNAAQPIRLALTDQAPLVKGDLYIDLDADGVFNNKDVKVGSLELTKTDGIADAPDVIDGIDVVSGDNGTILFKVVDKSGNVVGTKAITVKF